MKTVLTISGPEDITDQFVQQLKEAVASLGAGKRLTIALTAKDEAKPKKRKTYDSWVSKEEFEAKILAADAAIDRGEGIRFSSVEEMKAYFAEQPGLKP